MIIIEGDVHEDIQAFEVDNRSLVIGQGDDLVAIDNQQARQLIEALQKWIDGEEIK